MPRLKLDPTAPFGVSVAEPPARSIPQQNGYVAKIQLLNELQDVNIATTPSDDQALAYDTATGKWIPQTIAGGGGGATNLAATLSATNTIITSDTGTDATIPATDATNAGVMTPTQKTKLDGIATGATANSSDATLLDRANHTGTQLSTTISDFSAAADARISNAAGTSIASLSGGKVPTSQLPAVSLTSVQTAISEAAQLALTTQEGDVVVRTDENKTYMKNTGTAGTMADFTLLNTPTDAVTSVNGYTGVVSLAKADVGLGNVDNTSDASKPISTATQTALDAKAASADLTAHTGATAVHGATGAVVGTTNTQTLTNKTLTSPVINTPTGIVKGDVGLGNVDNTSDATKNSAVANLTNKTLNNTNTVTLKDFSFTLQSQADTTAQGYFDLSEIPTASVRAYKLPNATTTLVGDTNTQTLENKTLGVGSVIGASATVTEVLKKVYPVGSVYIAVVSTSPATLLGFGTWVAFATGRTLVGIDTGQTEFDTVEETGGAKTHTLTTAEMPSHTHIQDAHSHTYAGVNSGSGNNGSSYPWLSDITNRTPSTNNTTAVNQNTGGGGAHNNLQPYIVTYMWKRTA